jgi:hypothetical protein
MIISSTFDSTTFEEVREHYANHLLSKFPLDTAHNEIGLSLKNTKFWTFDTLSLVYLNLSQGATNLS